MAIWQFYPITWWKKSHVAWNTFNMLYTEYLYVIQEHLNIAICCVKPYCFVQKLSIWKYSQSRKCNCLIEKIKFKYYLNITFELIIYIHNCLGYNMFTHNQDSTHLNGGITEEKVLIQGMMHLAAGPHDSVFLDSNKNHICSIYR